MDEFDYENVRVIYPNDDGGGANTGTTSVSRTTSATGGGGSHTHTFSGSSSGSFSGIAMDFAVQYIDVIICSKN